MRINYSPLMTVTTLDELFTCREALVVIRKSVSKVVAALFSNQDEIRRELNAEVAANLVKYLGSGQKKSGTRNS